MATNAFFITETYLKDNSPLSGNVDIAEIYPYARTAEKIYIQEAIGTSLYDDLITKITSDSDLSGYPNELTLVKKIREAVLWYTVYDALPFIATKIRNIGVVNQSGENINNADQLAVKELRNECKTKGDFFLKRVQAYLCENGNLFSAYKCGTGDQIDPNLRTPSSECDIYFDKQDDNRRSKFYRKYGH